jgi:hypothetical protein
MQELARWSPMQLHYQISAASGSTPFLSPPSQAGHSKAISRKYLQQRIGPTPIAAMTICLKPSSCSSRTIRHIPQNTASWATTFCHSFRVIHESIENGIVNAIHATQHTKEIIRELKTRGTCLPTGKSIFRFRAK